MSINSAMLAGVSGLVANSSALAAISDNIANVNTVGYKRSSANFSTLVTSGSKNQTYSAGGVVADDAGGDHHAVFLDVDLVLIVARGGGIGEAGRAVDDVEGPGRGGRNGRDIGERRVARGAHLVRHGGRHRLLRAQVGVDADAGRLFGRAADGADVDRRQLHQVRRIGRDRAGDRIGQPALQIETGVVAQVAQAVQLERAGASERAGVRRGQVLGLFSGDEETRARDRQV